MTTITAKVIADSVSHFSPRITTLHLHYPRCIHSEFMTYRMFSRNAGSSRAIPIQRLIDSVMEDPFIPLHWGAAQSGMQAFNECDNFIIDPWMHDTLLGDVHITRENAWLLARDNAVKMSKAFLEAGYAKQLVNRLLEPFAHIDVVVTATEWDNFFSQRDHEDAEPHIAILARKIKDALRNSTPERLDYDHWHLPYITYKEMENIDDIEILKNISVARCARVSYKPFEGEGSIEKDITMANKLRADEHWSPFEHQATPCEYVNLEPFYGGTWRKPEFHGNFVGWKQNRQLIQRGVDFKSETYYN